MHLNTMSDDLAIALKELEEWERTQLQRLKDEGASAKIDFRFVAESFGVYAKVIRATTKRVIELEKEVARLEEELAKR
jgi:hypothetical protein